MPSLPGAARPRHSPAKKRPASGRHNVALRHKLFETRAGCAIGVASATQGLSSPARHSKQNSKDLVVRRREPLAALGAAPFEHETTILGRHAGAKSMGL